MTPWTAAHHGTGSSVHEFSRQEYWSGLPFLSPDPVLRFECNQGHWTYTCVYVLNEWHTMYMHTYISLYLFKICTYPKTKVTKRLCEGTYTQGSSNWVHAEVKTSFEDKWWHLWQVTCIPEPRFPHLWNGDRASLSGFLGGQNKMMYVEFLVKRWAWDKWQSSWIKNWVDTVETDPEPCGRSWEKRGPLAGLQRSRFWIWEGGSAPGSMWCTRRKMRMAVPEGSCAGNQEKVQRERNRKLYKTPASEVLTLVWKLQRSATGSDSCKVVFRKFPSTLSRYQCRLSVSLRF